MTICPKCKNYVADIYFGGTGHKCSDEPIVKPDIMPLPDDPRMKLKNQRR